MLNAIGSQSSKWHSSSTLPAHRLCASSRITLSSALAANFRCRCVLKILNEIHMQPLGETAYPTNILIRLKVLWFRLEEHLKGKPKITSVTSNVKQRCGPVAACGWTTTRQATAHSWVWYTCVQPVWDGNKPHQLKVPIKEGHTMSSLKPKGNFTLLSMDVVHHPVLFLPSPSYCKNSYEKIALALPAFHAKAQKESCAFKYFLKRLTIHQ